MKKTLLALSVLLASSAFAQEFPSKPIRWVVPFAAGGPADVIARTIQPELAKALGQTVADALSQLMSRAMVAPGIACTPAATAAPGRLM